jgi:ABC-type transporter Mla maintaining outer membrane lipid asymmetry ATPase subunit MlaF
MSPVLPIERPSAATGDKSGYALEFENVCLAFDDKVVLDGISFRLHHGETKALALIGDGSQCWVKKSPA